MKPQNGAWLVLASLLTACAPVGWQRLERADLSTLQTPELCQGFYDASQPAFPKGTNSALQERIGRVLVERKMLAEDDLRRVRSGMVQVGDNLCHALAAWGRPEDVNRTATTYGESQQWVYPEYAGTYRTGRARYLYLERGRVTAIQD